MPNIRITIEVLDDNDNTLSSVSTNCYNTNTSDDVIDLYEFIGNTLRSEPKIIGEDCIG